MKMQIAAASLITALAAGTAIAQTTTTPPPPPLGPTEVQCNQGFKEGMGWTREQFAKACADLAAVKKP